MQRNVMIGVYILEPALVFAIWAPLFGYFRLGALVPSFC